jgi:protein phosphatase
MLRSPSLNSLVISSFGTSDVGLVRDKNEDNFLIDVATGVYVVADGLGGVPYGDRASAMAVHMVKDYFDSAIMRGDIFLKEMFNEINRATYREGHRLNPDLGMATTLTVAQISDGRLVIGHVGDSAIFLYRNGTLRQLTAEHTVRAAVCAALPTDEYENIPEALGHTLTRCIGNSTSVEVDVVQLALHPGDRLLLCTDGVTKYMEFSFIEKAMAIAANPEILAKTLVGEARDRGGMDNATAVGLFVRGNTPRIFGLSGNSGAYAAE